MSKKYAVLSGENICYQAFGQDVDIKEFNNSMNALEPDVRELLYDVAKRLSMISKSLSPALQLYLLCTCIDGLANFPWIEFYNWLDTKNPIYNLDERNSLLQKISDAEPITSESDFVEVFKELYSVYSQHHGVGKKFKQFFSELPDATKQFLLASYIIVEEDDTQEKIAQWHEQPEDERLEAIASYIYNYRRNSFTHGVQEYPTTGTLGMFVRMQEAAPVFPENPSGHQILMLFKGNDYESGKLEHTILINKDEAFVLRVSVISHCRKILNIATDENFIQRHMQQHKIWLILKDALKEIETNWKTYKYYSIDWMAYEDRQDVYNGLPEFKWERLESVLELDLTAYGQIAYTLRQNIRGSSFHLKKLNEAIQEFNSEYPPLYIRQKNPELDSKPEEWGVRKYNKSNYLEPKRLKMQTKE